MEEIIEIYGDVIVTIFITIACFGLLAACVEIYRLGIVGLFDSIMYGGRV